MNYATNQTNGKTTRHKHTHTILNTKMASNLQESPVIARVDRLAEWVDDAPQQHSEQWKRLLTEAGPVKLLPGLLSSLFAIVFILLYYAWSKHDDELNIYRLVN